jgi:hypothetical protein
MTSQEIFWVASASAAWIGLSVAGLSMAFAMLSYRRAFHEEQARLYLELRRRYFEGRKGLSPRYFNDAEEPNRGFIELAFERAARQVAVLTTPLRTHRRRRSAICIRLRQTKPR